MMKSVSALLIAAALLGGWAGLNPGLWPRRVKPTLRRTGDGYYESVILDPENNRIEITA